MTDEIQIIAFFAPRQVKVTITIFLEYEESMQRSEILILVTDRIQEAISSTNTKLVQTTSDMDKVVLPMLVPISPQQAKELEGKICTLLKVVQQYQNITETQTSEEKLSTKPLQNWLHTVYTCLDIANKAISLAMRHYW